MTLQQLQYAISLEQHASFSRAANALGISQPALSIQIRKLEERINIIIFNRTRSSVKPTYEGQIFLERAQMILTQVNQLQDLVSELQDDFSGELHVGIIPTLAPYLLPLFIKELNEKYPKLIIHVHEALTQEVIQSVKTGELDVGIISTPIESKTKLMVIPLFYEEFRLFISTEHPLFAHDKINTEDIPLEDLWLLKEGNCFRDQIDNICDISRRKGAHDLFFYESNSIEALCRIVEFKGGITFLPELSTVQFGSEHEDMIKELKGPKRVREISVVHLPNNSKKHKLDRLVQIIQASIPKRLLSKSGAKTIPTNIKL